MKKEGNVEENGGYKETTEKEKQGVELSTSRRFTRDGPKRIRRKKFLLIIRRPTAAFATGTYGIRKNKINMEERF